MAIAHNRLQEETRSLGPIVCSTASWSSEIRLNTIVEFSRSKEVYHGFENTWKGRSGLEVGTRVNRKPDGKVKKKGAKKNGRGALFDTRDTSLCTFSFCTPLETTPGGINFI